MKTELRLKDHFGIPEAKVVEIWYGEKFIGTITGADGPGVRIFSKHPVMVAQSSPPAGIQIIQATINPEVIA